MAQLFGDAEAAVVAILRADVGVAGRDPAGIATDLIGYSAPARWLRVQRTGGAPTPWRGVDNPRIEIASYADDKGAALDLLVAARAAVFAARGVYVGNGLRLADVMDDPQGMASSQDERVPTTPRYTLTLSLVTRPAP